MNMGKLTVPLFCSEVTWATERVPPTLPLTSYSRQEILPQVIRARELALFLPYCSTLESRTWTSLGQCSRADLRCECYRLASPEDEWRRVSPASCLLCGGTHKGDTPSSPSLSLTIYDRWENWPWGRES